MDPFHDFEFTPKGLPDTFAGNTVVQTIKKQINIAAPASLADDALWDCHICSLPILDTVDASAGFADFASITPNPVSVASKLGTIVVNTALSGQMTFPDNNVVFAPTNFVSAAYSPSDGQNTFSMQRIYGGGWEVTNTTADLYKNGSVCVYSQPQEITDNPLDDLSSGGSFIAQLARMPPGTLSQANSNVNSVTWAAADGCYVPLRLDVADAKFRQATCKPLVFLKGDDTSGTDYPVLYQNFSFPAPADGPLAHSDVGVRSAGLETVGSYFTGLSKQTTLTLTIRFIVEIAPTPSNQTLISLASPSSEYDPAALALYTRAVRELPPGTPVKNNADGDWWKIVSSAVKMAAPAIQAAGPMGAVVGTLAKGAVTGIDIARNIARNPEIKKMREEIRLNTQKLREEKKKKKAEKKLPDPGMAGKKLLGLASKR